MPSTVANFDVAGAADRVVTFARELIASQSARQAEFNSHDRGRATAYLGRLESYVGVISTPSNPLDLPKTHPSSYPVADFPADEEINAIENAEVRDLVRRFKAGYVELIHSQSKDRATGIFEADKGRLEALIENAKGIISFGAESVDLPENPADVPATAGK
ncbi:MAG: hypothetical protein ACOC93_00140 [Planctomycetota bacterium]